MSRLKKKNGTRSRKNNGEEGEAALRLIVIATKNFSIFNKKA
jgi:hypothetical protein